MYLSRFSLTTYPAVPFFSHLLCCALSRFSLCPYFFCTARRKIIGAQQGKRGRDKGTAGQVKLRAPRRVFFRVIYFLAKNFYTLRSLVFVELMIRVFIHFIHFNSGDHVSTYSTLHLELSGRRNIGVVGCAGEWLPLHAMAYFVQANMSSVSLGWVTWARCMLDALVRRVIRK